MEPHPNPPLPLSSTRKPSTTFPLTHGSAPSQRPKDQQSLDQPFAYQPENIWAHRRSSRRVHSQADGETSPGPVLTGSHSRHSPHHHHHRHHIDPLDLDGPKSHHRHKHSKSREIRLPRPMSQLASSASARGLLPAWSSSRDKDREGDDGLLRPITRETTRSRWGSDSTTGLGTGSRRGSLLDTPEQHERLGPIRRQEIQSIEDLEQVKKRRKQGEEYLRSALSSIGTLATDLTRRLDYTYYNLLEKVTALNSTIGSFQELSDSASVLLNDFERETAGLDQETRKQINDLKGFEPQIQKADALEARMKVGRKRVEGLGTRLESVRREIDSWEKREFEWQSRVSRRLRIFWAVVTSALLVLVLALVLQHWPALSLPSENLPPLTETLNRSSPGAPDPSDTWESVLGLNAPKSQPGSSWYPSSLADRRQSLEHAAPSVTLMTSSQDQPDAAPTEHDPLRVLDEL
ncbi:uncharacterized protein N7459_003724 [Penicillium hispanicum]|uniref:uncharacterized protein n=1 Tax=Penicillium hispanicum TaxID=1080232 RepID=UPI002541C973|nr:uncharacterized protein N7459_003724 [Penicillium hispanicum]KAJ5587959.1 hypothetical protein N7459_003724 [Penicillium hispanicum]